MHTDSDTGIIVLALLQATLKQLALEPSLTLTLTLHGTDGTDADTYWHWH